MSITDNPVKYVGTKEVLGTPMTLNEFNAYVGKVLVEGELDEAGYLVEYLNGGKPNHCNHTGYISWSPKDVFEEAYFRVDTAKAQLQLEYNELAVRFAELKGIILGQRPYTITRAQWNAMIVQHAYMRSYLATLEQRIYLFDSEV